MGRFAIALGTHVLYFGHLFILYREQETFLSQLQEHSKFIWAYIISSLIPIEYKKKKKKIVSFQDPDNFYGIQSNLAIVNPAVLKTWLY